MQNIRTVEQADPYEAPPGRTRLRWSRQDPSRPNIHVVPRDAEFHVDCDRLGKVGTAVTWCGTTGIGE